jgi:hypothetical protein
LWVCHFPRRLVYIWGVFPLPGWGLGLIYLVTEVAATQQQSSDDHVAHVAHLAGALFAFIYFRTGWNLGKLVPGRWSIARPHLKIHDPGATERDLSRQVDRILEKISREGESSLSKEERQILEEASRRYQRRRQ